MVYRSGFGDFASRPKFIEAIGRPRYGLPDNSPWKRTMLNQSLNPRLALIARLCLGDHGQGRFWRTARGDRFGQERDEVVILPKATSSSVCIIMAQSSA